MKALCLCISLALAIINLSIEYSSASELNSAVLAEEAGNSGQSAPFTKLTNVRLASGAFGKTRAARSSDVIVFNFSTKDFQLIGKSCVHGHFDPHSEPEPQQPAKTSTIFRIKSKGVWIKVDCTVRFAATEGQQGSWFTLRVKNPMWGNAVLDEKHSTDLSVAYKVTQKKNNQVKVMIYDA